MATLSISMVQKIGVEVEGDGIDVKQSLYHVELREMGKQIIRNPTRGFII